MSVWCVCVFRKKFRNAQNVGKLATLHNADVFCCLPSIDFDFNKYAKGFIVSQKPQIETQQQNTNFF